MPLVHAAGDVLTITFGESVQGSDLFQFTNLLRAGQVVIIDCARVTRYERGAFANFATFKKRCEAAHALLIFSGIKKEGKEALKASGQDPKQFQIYANLARANGAATKLLKQKRKG